MLERSRAERSKDHNKATAVTTKRLRSKASAHLQCEFIILTFGINLSGKNLFMLKLTLV